MVASGTGNRWYVDCLMCAEPFEMAWERLSFRQDGTPVEAAESVVMVCPHEGCGGAHVQADKPALMATGRWVGKGETAVSWSTGTNLGKVGEIEVNTVDSYYWDGVFGLAPWSSLARQYRSAELRFEEHQDEGPIKSFWQTKVGRNDPGRGRGDAPVTEDALMERARASTYRMGTVPDGVIAITHTVDLGADRFSVMAVGHGLNNRAWIIDRFDITTLDDGITKVEPFRKREHWKVLHKKVLAKRYPLARDPSLSMRVLCTGVDTGGAEDATDNAYAWWHDMVTGSLAERRPALPASAIMLLKGGNRPNGVLLPRPTVDAKRQVEGAPECELVVPNVNRFKSIADYRIRRAAAGPAFIDLPREFADLPLGRLVNPYVAELRAEEEIEGRWEKPEGVRNETWDLLVYALVVIMKMVGRDPNLSAVPSWARPPRVAAPTIALPPPTDDDPAPPPPRPAGPKVTRQGTPARPSSAAPRRGVRIVRSR